MEPSTVDEHRARLTELLAAMSPRQTPPWTWHVRKEGDMYLSTIGRGRQIIMNFIRHGMQAAQPRFQDHAQGIMYPVKHWIGEDGLFRHVDAEYIEAACNAVPALLEEIRNLQAKLVHQEERNGA